MPRRRGTKRRTARRRAPKRYDSNGALETIGAGARRAIDGAAYAWDTASGAWDTVTDTIGTGTAMGFGLGAGAVAFTDTGRAAGHLGLALGRGAANEVMSDHKWGEGVFLGYDFAAYWKMRLIDMMLSLVDRREQTNPYVLWFIDMALQYLGQGDYLTFMGIFAGLAALRNADRVVTLKDLYALLPENAEEKALRLAKTEGYTYAGSHVIRRRARRRRTVDRT